LGIPLLCSFALPTIFAMNLVDMQQLADDLQISWKCRMEQQDIYR
jgi:predicted outer membrane lipoprotein